VKEMLRALLFATAICSAFCGLTLGADFGGRSIIGTVKPGVSARVAVSRFPDMLLSGRTVVVKNRPGIPFRDWAALQLAIEQAMAVEFTPTQGKADIALTVAVSGYSPVIARYINTVETRTVIVKKPLGKNPLTGQPIMVDVRENKEVGVQYWEARGEMTLTVEARDGAAAPDAAPLDSFNPKGEYYRKIETLENRVSKYAGALPTAPELQASLFAKVASQVQKRYAKSTETVEVPLTVDDELRAGNAFASSGQWKDAIAAWSAVQTRKHPGDKLYNIAVAEEALAYQTLDPSQPEEGDAAIQKTMGLYQEAMKLDPAEKAFREGISRCAEMKASFTRAKDQAAAMLRRERVLAAQPQTPIQPDSRTQVARGNKTVESTAETPDEAAFRSIIRGRLRSQAAPAAAVVTQLVRSGKNYNLEEDAARRVVDQEIERIGEYKVTFADLVRDQSLDASERAQIADLAQRLRLTPEDTKAIEAQFRFREVK
jgi:tetratricopeptide (TPR) repeat protein